MECKQKLVRRFEPNCKFYDFQNCKTPRLPPLCPLKGIKPARRCHTWECNFDPEVVLSAPAPDLQPDLPTSTTSSTSLAVGLSVGLVLAIMVICGCVFWIRCLGRRVRARMNRPYRPHPGDHPYRPMPAMPSLVRRPSDSEYRPFRPSAQMPHLTPKPQLVRPNAPRPTVKTSSSRFVRPNFTLSVSHPKVVRPKRNAPPPPVSTTQILPSSTFVHPNVTPSVSQPKIVRPKRNAPPPPVSTTQLLPSSPFVHPNVTPSVTRTKIVRPKDLPPPVPSVSKPDPLPSVSVPKPDPVLSVSAPVSRLYPQLPPLSEPSTPLVLPKNRSSYFDDLLSLSSADSILSLHESDRLDFTDDDKQTTRHDAFTTANSTVTSFHSQSFLFHSSLQDLPTFNTSRIRSFSLQTLSTTFSPSAPPMTDSFLSPYPASPSSYPLVRHGFCPRQSPVLPHLGSVRSASASTSTPIGAIVDGAREIGLERINQHPIRCHLYAHTDALAACHVIPLQPHACDLHLNEANSEADVSDADETLDAASNELEAGHYGDSTVSFTVSDEAALEFRQNQGRNGQ